MSLKKVIFKLFSAVLLSGLIMSTSYAEQMVKLGKWDVHYIAFPSTFIQASTANAIGVKRRNNNALINISILDSKTKKPLKKVVVGNAKNLLGQMKALTFIEVDEGNAVYYIAEVAYRNEEVLTFNIDIAGQKLQFKQKLYVD